MAIPILNFWENYFSNPDEGLGSTYERFIINKVLLKVLKHYRVKSVLESPSFGFTGLSGINSVILAKNNCEVFLMDHNQKRLDLIESVWKKLNLELKTIYTKDYQKIPLPDQSIDLSWNFSALWFVTDLENFLNELSRVTRKIILIMVPNQTGIGYLHQKYTGKKDLQKYLKEENINTSTIKNYMKKINWSLLDHQFIDCPPWPDIGMSKENFLKKLKLDFLANSFEGKKESVSILDYYNDSQPEMISRFLKLEWLEKSAPNAFKKIWSHHQYMIFYKKQ